MNMVCQYGMITFLAKGKSLQPFSICLEWNGDFKLIEEMVRVVIQHFLKTIVLQFVFEVIG